MPHKGAFMAVTEQGECDAALDRIRLAYRELIRHEGFGEMRVEVKILKRGQKEVIVHFGKQYRYVVDAI